MAHINNQRSKDEDYANSHFIVMGTKKGIIKTSLEQYQGRELMELTFIIKEGDQLLEFETQLEISN